ncbi:phospholipid-translocating P-type ATPase, flippase family protein (macronuclear) [Tetrahymena thermophila SB210]|uniref:Phospholipid-transporting ATPase n=1 Tax=Tetrahymena thermophila (strain SB210) TaxID=312017 RepID=I7MAN3_TETTS|nr:phospholipid-translocating P-type ATPase, flippase family protein [Tetrahymena thermophila SB210]EAS04930.2 phospholipid-translocating P-type ATPase, flippase family protein [Tetrahymena thermophila SB210]|eukprot:XP_001025175.2 phospholipid-translocating P-type ATPase, flippase family protein [Tetrahymena thermophila SB210]
MAYKGINGENSYNNKESLIEEQKDVVDQPSLIFRNNSSRAGVRNNKDNNNISLDIEGNKSNSGNSFSSQSKQNQRQKDNSQIKMHNSSQSSSFLTIPRDDTSQIVVNEKYKQNVIRNEQCIHVKEPLLKVRPKQEANYKLTFFQKLKNLIGNPDPQKVERQIYINGDIFPQNYQINQIKNSKYSLLTFLPLVLWNHFQNFMNLLYLIITISQFIYDLKVGYVYTYLSPVIFIVFLVMAREVYDNIKIFVQDSKYNQTVFKVLNYQNQFQEVKIQELKIGQIIELQEGQPAPADLLILYSSNINGNILIKTDHFDGKTKQISRKAINYFQQDIKKRQNDYLQLIDTDGYVEIPPPSANYSQFEATFYLNDGYSKYNEKITIENAIWQNSTVSNGFILGLIIYTGSETKTNMNMKSPRFKIGKFDLEANFLMKIFFLIVIFYSCLIVIIKGNIMSSIRIVIDFIRYLILLCNIIPVCLKINLEMVKIYFTFRINNDPDMEGVNFKDQNIPEELGRVQFLLADKTGTLTKNEMIFNRVALEQATYTHEDMIVMQSIIINQCQRYLEPLANYQLTSSNTQSNDYKFQKRAKEEIFRDLVNAMCICNTVSPGIELISRQSKYLGESQEEVAFVEFAEQLGIKLVTRNEDTIGIENCRENKDYYQILDLFEFSSEKNRMGIIVKHLSSQKIIYYVKGSAREMSELVIESSRKFINEESSNIGSEGIRVMVFAQKQIDQNDYNKWKQAQLNKNINVNMSSPLMRNNIQNASQMFDQFEKDMEFLGIVGVEDQLRDGVQQTIETLTLAGISVWIVSGDSMQTTISAAIQSGIKQNDQHFNIVKKVYDDIDIKAKLMYINSDRNSKKQILVMDGQSLSVAMEVDKKQLVNVCTRAASVLLCECTPQQKHQIIDLIKQYTDYRIAAIGDGANDVGMIQSAHLGIGISDSDNKLAQLAADVTIPEFYYLNQLLLWHGRCYKKAVSLCSFVYQRGLVIAFIELIFVGVFYTITIQIFNAQLLLCYATIFTIFPVLTLVMDSDIDINTCISFPQLYKSALKGRHLNLRTFFSWIWKAVYQATVLMMLIFTFFQRQYFLNIETFVLFELIFTEYFMIFSKIYQIKKIKWIQALFIGISLIIYLLILIFLQPQFDIGNIWTLQTIGILLLIILIALIPMLVIHLLRMKIEPTDDEKVLRSALNRASSEQLSQ